MQLLHLRSRYSKRSSQTLKGVGPSLPHPKSDATLVKFQSINYIIFAKKHSKASQLQRKNKKQHIFLEPQIFPAYFVSFFNFTSDDSNKNLETLVSKLSISIQSVIYMNMPCDNVRQFGTFATKKHPETNFGMDLEPTSR